MDGKLLTSRDFIAEVYRRVYPSDLAFPHDGRSHVYSGPDSWIYEQYVPLLGNKIGNRKRGMTRAARDGELIIDNSEAGKYLISFQEEGMRNAGVYAYFRDIAKLSSVERQTEGDRPWVVASKLFINSMWGSVSTTVCGADRERVFYNVELPYMMTVVPQLLQKLQKTKDIERINGFKTNIFRTAFSAIGPEKAFQYFCLTEQRKVLRQALETREKDVYADYLDTLEMYNLDKRRQGVVGKHPLNVLNPQERKVWKESEMTRFANRTLSRIDDVLGVRPKQLLTKMPFIKTVPLELR